MSLPEHRDDPHVSWRQVARPDATIHYLDTGGDGPPVVLISQSMGAHTALVTASRHPVW